LWTRLIGWLPGWLEAIDQGMWSFWGWGRGKFMNLEQKMAAWKWQNCQQYPFFSNKGKRCAERVFSIHTAGPIQISSSFQGVALQV